MSSEPHPGATNRSVYELYTRQQSILDRLRVLSTGVLDLEFKLRRQFPQKIEKFGLRTRKNAPSRRLRGSDGPSEQSGVSRPLIKHFINLTDGIEVMEVRVSFTVFDFGDLVELGVPRNESDRIRANYVISMRTGRF
eukprot:1045457-Amorphochlora_amoeboformis.AAC.3